MSLLRRGRLRARRAHSPVPARAAFLPGLEGFRSSARSASVLGDEPVLDLGADEEAVAAALSARQDAVAGPLVDGAYRDVEDGGHVVGPEDFGGGEWPLVALDDHGVAAGVLDAAARSRVTAMMWSRRAKRTDLSKR